VDFGFHLKFLRPRVRSAAHRQLRVSTDAVWHHLLTKNYVDTFYKSKRNPCNVNQLSTHTQRKLRFIMKNLAEKVKLNNE